MSPELLEQLEIMGADEPWHLAYKLHDMFLAIMLRVRVIFPPRDVRKVMPRYPSIKQPAAPISAGAAARVGGLARSLTRGRAAPVGGTAAPSGV